MSSPRPTIFECIDSSVANISQRSQDSHFKVTAALLEQHCTVRRDNALNDSSSQAMLWPANLGHLSVASSKAPSDVLSTIPNPKMPTISEGSSSLVSPLRSDAGRRNNTLLPSPKRVERPSDQDQQLRRKPTRKPLRCGNKQCQAILPHQSGIQLCKACRSRILKERQSRQPRSSLQQPCISGQSTTVLAAVPTNYHGSPTRDAEGKMMRDMQAWLCQMRASGRLSEKNNLGSRTLGEMTGSADLDSSEREYQSADSLYAALAARCGSAPSLASTSRDENQSITHLAAISFCGHFSRIAGPERIDQVYANTLVDRILGVVGAPGIM